MEQQEEHSGQADIAEELPPLIEDDPKEVREALRAYYRTKDFFFQGLSHRKQSIAKSYINLSIIPLEQQQQKEEGLVGDDKQGTLAGSEKEQPAARPSASRKAPSQRDERLASFEALHVDPKPIALKAIFTALDKEKLPPKRLLVLGRAGIGKTTLSQHIAYEWATNGLWSQFSYLFWIPLRNLDQNHYQEDKQLSLAKVILQECFREPNRFSARLIADLLTTEAKQVLLLLDGYDEVAHLESKSQVGQVLQEALTFENSLVTSRPYPAPMDLPFDRRLENMGFTNENIEAYVTEYFKHPEVKQPEQAKLLLQFLRNNPNIWGTAHVPINVALICNAWEQALAEGESLNVRLQMTGLYQTLVRGLLKRSLERKGEPVYGMSPCWIEEQCEGAIRLLEQLAMTGLKTHQLILTPQLQREVLENLSGYDRTHFQEAVSLGVLQTVGHAKGDAVEAPHYFIHLTFQEFFAARFIVRSLHELPESALHQAAIEFIRNQKYTPRYQIVFWFIAGLLSAGQKIRPLVIFWTTLLSKPVDRVGIAHLRLLMHCLEEAYFDSRIPHCNRLLQHVGQTLVTVIKGAVNSKTSAFYSLTTYLEQCPYLGGHLQIIGPVIKMARQDRNAANRTHSLDILHQIPNPSTELVELFYERANQDKDDSVRRAALEALGKLPGPPPEVIRVLCERASQDEHSSVRRAALEVLGKLPGPPPEVIRALCERASQDEHSTVKQAALEALDKLPAPPPEVIRVLCERASQDENGNVRYLALEVLDKLPAAPPEVIPFLCELAIQNESGGVRVREAVLKALGKLPAPPPGVIRVLCEQAQDKDNFVRQAALKALGKLPGPPPEVIRVLCERASQDKDDYVRGAVVEALGKLPGLPPEVIRALCERASQDECYSVKQAALKALGKLPDPPLEVIRFLYERASKYEYYSVREAVFEALYGLPAPSPEVIPVLREQASQDKNHYVRLAAIIALGKVPTPSPEVIRVLCERASQDEDHSVRRTALEALARLPAPPPEGVIRFLYERACQDEDHSVRRIALEALARLPAPLPEGVIRFLYERACQDEDHSVRRTALEALVRLPAPPPEGVIRFLYERACQDEDRSVRRAAVQALVRLSAPPPEGVIRFLYERACQDEDRSVRQVAFEALVRLPAPPPEVIRVLCERASQDKDDFVRRATIHTLYNLPTPPPEVIRVLCERASQDKYLIVRRVALKALGKLPAPPLEVIPVLCERASIDKDDSNRYFALEALMTIDTGLILSAYLSELKYIFRRNLADSIIRRALSYALIITHSSIVVSDGRTKPCALPDEDSRALAKELKTSCAAEAKKQGLPPAIRLSILTSEALQDEILQTQENEASFLRLKESGLTNVHVKNYLIPFLQGNSTLTALDLSNNQALTDDSARGIAAALKANDTLMELNLQGNNIGDQGLNAFIHLLGGQAKEPAWFGFFSREVPKIISANKTLCTLHLSPHPSILAATMKELQSLLARNQAWRKAGVQLLRSIKVNNLKGIEHALKEGALFGITNKKGQRPLHYAVLCGHMKSVKYLLEGPTFRCPIDSPNHQGVTALYIACANGKWGMVNYLLSQGASVNAVDREGRSALHHAAKNGDKVVLNYLLTHETSRNKVAVNLPDHQGQTPLHYTVAAENESATLLLLRCGADFSAKDHRDDTPLMLADRQGNPVMISYLEKAKSGELSPLPSLPPHSQAQWVKVCIWFSHATESRLLNCITLETAAFQVKFGEEDSSSEADTPKNNLSSQEVILYSLDADMIEEAYHQFRTDPRQWALTGRKKFQENAQDCSSLAADLLMAGGLEQLVGTPLVKKFWEANSAAIGELLARAKSAELKKYPDTRNYTKAPEVGEQHYHQVTQHDYEQVLEKAQQRLSQPITSPLGFKVELDVNLFKELSAAAQEFLVEEESTALVEEYLQEALKEVERINKELMHKRFHFKEAGIHEVRKHVDKVQGCQAKVKSCATPANKEAALAFLKEIEAHYQTVLEQYDRINNSPLYKDESELIERERALAIEQQKFAKDPRFNELLERIKLYNHHQGQKIFISHMWCDEGVAGNAEREQWVSQFLRTLDHHLEKLGFQVSLDLKAIGPGDSKAEFMQENIPSSHYVLLVGTESLFRKSQSDSDDDIKIELSLIRSKRFNDIKLNLHRVIPVVLTGTEKSALPLEYRDLDNTPLGWSGTGYLAGLKALFEKLGEVGQGNNEYQACWGESIWKEKKTGEKEKVKAVGKGKEKGSKYENNNLDQLNKQRFFSTGQVSGPKTYKSNNWAEDYGIEKTLKHYLGDITHIIEPSLSSVHTPLNSCEGIKNYLERIAGYQDTDGALHQNGFIDEDGGKLTKPIVMIINTHSVRVNKATDTSATGGHHWVTCVILPKQYTVLTQTFTRPTEAIFFIDALFEEARLPTEFRKALTEGMIYEGHRFPSDRELQQDLHLTPQTEIPFCHRIPAAFPKAEFYDCINIPQQEGGSDCGWWALYNALMFVLTGDDAFTKQFKLRQSIPQLRALFSGLTVAATEASQPYLIAEKATSLAELAHLLVNCELNDLQVAALNSDEKPMRLSTLTAKVGYFTTSAPIRDTQPETRILEQQYQALPLCSQEDMQIYYAEQMSQKTT